VARMRTKVVDQTTARGSAGVIKLARKPQEVRGAWSGWDRRKVPDHG
jgi:hypothetical protein